MARRKRRIFEHVEVIDIADKGMSIGRKADGEIILVKGAVPGDIVDVETYRKKKGLFLANVVKHISYSDHRTEPFCAHFKYCGGCKWQDLLYSAQLSYKENQLKQTIHRLAGENDFEFQSMLGADKTRFYRNKLEFTCSSSRWLTPEEIQSGENIDVKPAIGFHPPGTYYKVLDIETCHLQEEPTNVIRNFLESFGIENGLSFYDIQAHKGLLRNLVIRVFDSGQVLVMVIFGERDDHHIGLVMRALDNRFPEITSLWYIVNTKLNDSYIDLEPEHYAGDQYVMESLGQIKYEIGPKSFFQTHTAQAVRLYDVALDFAALSRNDVVYDLYCGLGSITLYMAGYCREIIGIEHVDAAISDARRNAALNGIENAHFYSGDADLVHDVRITERHGKPDVVITDPPRAGMSAEVVEGILKLAPERIVYISCNPSTQARDISRLASAYRLEKVRGVDMFPHTSHIESVALLRKKEGP